jgi:1-acyl-sn-glycerol-3-phosphate acyltransferase
VTQVRTALRRVVMFPLVFGVQCVILLCCPLLLVMAGLLSLLRRSSRPWRTVVLVTTFALIELRTIAAVIGQIDDVDGLIREVLTGCYGAMRRSLAVPMVLEEGSATAEEVAACDGLVVLARHCGPGDSIYVAWLLAVHYNLSLRIVLKQAMRLEPAIDLAGDRLPFCFVGHAADAEQEIGELAGELGAGQALLLFPEGGNFSWERWRSGLRYLTSNGDLRGARRAAGRTHTLQPRAGGALAALQAAPHADVLVLTHSGFSPDGRDRVWWQLPVHRDFVVRTMLFPAADVPRDQAGAVEFVEQVWTQVDTWVEAWADLNAPDHPPGDRLNDQEDRES